MPSLMSPNFAEQFAALGQAGQENRYRQKQRNAFAQAGNMAAGGDYSGAAGALMRSGQLEQGMALQGYADERTQAAAQADMDKRRQAAGATAQLLANVRRLPVEQRAAAFGQGVSMLAPYMDAPDAGQRMMQQIQANPQALSDAEIDQALSVMQAGGLYAPPEPTKGVVLGSDSRLVNPVTGQMMVEAAPKDPRYETVTTAEGIFEYIPGQPDSMRKIGNAPIRTPQTVVNVAGDAPPMPSTDTLTPFQKKQDEILAPMLAEWNTGGGADAAKNLNQLNEVANRLEAGGSDLTGALIGLTPDWALAGLNPQAMDTKDLVEEVVQRNLRVVLGAQFTASESAELIRRSYNKSLPEEMNAARLRRLVQSVQARAQAMENLNEYVRRNGTSAGWDGSIPSVSQIINEVEGAGRGVVGPRQGQGRTAFNPQLGEFAPPQSAVNALRSNPSLREQFDQKYGPGSAAKALGE